MLWTREQGLLPCSTCENRHQQQAQANQQVVQQQAAEAQANQQDAQKQAAGAQANQQGAQQQAAGALANPAEQVVQQQALFNQQRVDRQAAALGQQCGAGGEHIWMERAGSPVSEPMFCCKCGDRT